MGSILLRMIQTFHDNRSFEVSMTPDAPRGMEWAVNNLVADNTDLG